MSEASGEHLAAALAGRRGLFTDHGVPELERRLALAERQDWKCSWCELTFTPVDIGAGLTHLDHVIPRARGGPDARWNKELLHGDCNLSKRKQMTAKGWELAAERGITVTPPDPDAMPVQAIRIHADDWADFNDATGGRGAEVARMFIRWYLWRKGSRRPTRPEVD